VSRGLLASLSAVEGVLCALRRKINDSRIEEDIRRGRLCYSEVIINS